MVLREMELQLETENFHISIKKLYTGNSLMWVVGEAHNEFRSIVDCLALFVTEEIA